MTQDENIQISFSISVTTTDIFKNIGFIISEYVSMLCCITEIQNSFDKQQEEIQIIHIHVLYFVSTFCCSKQRNYFHGSLI